MQHIQTPRIYGHETGVRYILNFEDDNMFVDSLTACFLIAKNQELLFESLTISTNESSACDFKKQDIDEIISTENFINQIPQTITSWHLQMRRNNYPISFGACLNKEIGCTYHHWCLIDVDSFMEEIEKQVKQCNFAFKGV